MKRTDIICAFSELTVQQRNIRHKHSVIGAVEKKKKKAKKLRWRIMEMEGRGRAYFR